MQIIYSELQGMHSLNPLSCWHQLRSEIGVLGELLDLPQSCVFDVVLERLQESKYESNEAPKDKGNSLKQHMLDSQAICVLVKGLDPHEEVGVVQLSLGLKTGVSWHA